VSPPAKLYENQGTPLGAQVDALDESEIVLNETKVVERKGCNEEPEQQELVSIKHELDIIKQELETLEDGNIDNSDCDDADMTCNQLAFVGTLRMSNRTPSRYTYNNFGSPSNTSGSISDLNDISHHTSVNADGEANLVFQYKSPKKDQLPVPPKGTPTQHLNWVFPSSPGMNVQTGIDKTSRLALFTPPKPSPTKIQNPGSSNKFSKGDILKPGVFSNPSSRNATPNQQSPFVPDTFQPRLSQTPNFSLGSWQRLPTPPKHVKHASIMRSAHKPSNRSRSNSSSIASPSTPLHNTNPLTSLGHPNASPPSNNSSPTIISITNPPALPTDEQNYNINMTPGLNTSCGSMNMTLTQDQNMTLTSEPSPSHQEQQSSTISNHLTPRRSRQPLTSPDQFTVQPLVPGQPIKGANRLLYRSPSGINFYRTSSKIHEIVEEVSSAQQSDSHQVIKVFQSDKKVHPTPTSVSKALHHTPLIPPDSVSTAPLSASLQSHKINDRMSPSEQPLQKLTVAQAAARKRSLVFKDGKQTEQVLSMSDKKFGKENTAWNDRNRMVASTSKKSRRKKRESFSNLIGATSVDQEQQLLTIPVEGKSCNLAHLVSDGIQKCLVGRQSETEPGAAEAIYEEEVLDFDGVKYTFGQFGASTFSELRKLFKVDAQEFSSLLGTIGGLKGQCSQGKSKSFFLIPKKRFVLKTMSRTEQKFFRSGFLNEYYQHVLCQPNTLLPRFYAMVKVECGSRCFEFIVMNNVFDTPLKIHQRFDLKGSSVGRSATAEEKAELGDNVILKDNDVVSAKRKIYLDGVEKKLLSKQLDADVEFLQRLSLIDYSFLVGVHIPSAVQQPLNLAQAMDEATEDQTGETTEVHRDEKYFMGIIDILQPYDYRKRFEIGLKAMVYDKSAISAAEPEFYGRRFLSFMKDLLGSQHSS